MDAKVGLGTRLLTLVGSLGLVTTASSPALAQGAAPPPPPPPLPAPTPPPPSSPPPTVVATPVPPPAPEGAALREVAGGEREELPDHDRFVRHIGITYFNVASLPIANPTGTTMPGPGQITSSTISAPVIGIRYWVQNNVGVDLGVGLGFAGGSQEAVQNNPTTGTSTDTTIGKTNTAGFAFHGGVPFAIYRGHHYSFLIIPQFTVGFTTGTQSFTAPPPLMPAPNQDLSGFLFDGGAVIGSEIHFGFIGIPELALQASVGLSYRRSSFKWKSGPNSASDGTNTFGTNVQPNPWAIFVNNISATYYF